MNQFSRTQLLLGKEAIQTLRQAKVAVFGIGGVGGYVCEALVRSGVGHFVLVDSDLVSVTNLNRQIIASWDTVGRPKTEVMAERMKSINPDVKAEVRNCFYLPENADYPARAESWHSGDQFDGRRQSSRSGSFSCRGSLSDQNVPAGESHAAGTEEKRRREAEGCLFGGESADALHGRPGGRRPGGASAREEKSSGQHLLRTVHRGPVNRSPGDQGSDRKVRQGSFSFRPGEDRQSLSD